MFRCDVLTFVMIFVLVVTQLHFYSLHDSHHNFAHVLFTLYRFTHANSLKRYRVHHCRYINSNITSPSDLCDVHVFMTVLCLARRTFMRAILIPNVPKHGFRVAFIDP
jgi:hypothetical protein